jgi:hypothetical protein
MFSNRESGFCDFPLLNEAKIYKMEKNWIWICRDDSELIYDVLVVPVPTKKRPIVKLALKTGVFVVQAFYWLKGVGVL